MTRPPRHRAAGLLAAALGLLASGGGASGPAVATGDRHWSRRATDPLAPATAVRAYEEATAADPRCLEARWKLLRALYYQGEFREREQAARHALAERSKLLAREALAELGRQAGVEDLERRPAEEAATLVRPVPEAAAVYFWVAVSWGLWGRHTGKLAAARQGVAERIRDYASVVTLLDAAFEGAGGHRMLGRLHAEAPRIPFLTGWVDRHRAVELLSEAADLAPEEPANRLFLAEALLEFQPGRRREAVALLEELGDASPRPDHLVEDRQVLAEARDLLDRHRSRRASADRPLGRYD